MKIRMKSTSLLSFVNRDGTEKQYGITPTPLAGMLKGDFAQIKRTCRIEDRNTVVKYGDKVFHEEVRYTDPEFLPAIYIST